MAKDKTHRYDDAFKAKARAHQFAFRENVLNVNSLDNSNHINLNYITDN